jgi:hypothetical protein
MEPKLLKREDQPPNAFAAGVRPQEADCAQGYDPGKQGKRRKAMQDLVGIRNERAEHLNAGAYIRSLRVNGRLNRLQEE